MTEHDRTATHPGVRRRAVQRIRLRVIEGPQSGLVHESEDVGPLAVGIAKDNQLVLSDPTVSRYHLELKRTEDGISIVDLGSRNGTYVGNVRIERALAVPGTRLRLGSTSIEIEDGGIATEYEDQAPIRIRAMVGASAAIKGIARTVERLASSNVPALIQGETGTGKELVARALADSGPRRDGPFIVVDCGSIPPTLIASELFGYERGAFTGADQRRAGAFERSNGGTIFLDEIGELPPIVQPALLGVLERRRFQRVGGDQEISIDVRIVCATHRDLRSEVNKGNFRADLYFRLAVARIEIPPLRQRPEDIRPLVEHFVSEMTGSRESKEFTPEVMAMLEQHAWPGNVRELRNVVETTLSLGEITLEGHPSAFSGETEETAASSLESVPLYKSARAAAIARFETTYLKRLMEETKGNASLASRRAGMDRPYLLSLLKKHKLR